MPTFDAFMLRFYREHPQEIETLKQAVIAEYEADKTMDICELLAIFRYIAQIEGFTKFAKRAKLPREQAYRATAPNANPTLSTLKKLADSCGLRISLVSK